MLANTCPGCGGFTSTLASLLWAEPYLIVCFAGQQPASSQELETFFETMSNPDLRTAIYDFIRKNFIYDEKRQISNDESFLSSGIIDSTGVVELIAFLEDTYHVHFEDEELVAENFDTLARLVAFMERKMDKPRALPEDQE